MSLADSILMFFAAILAGSINGAVGSGSLVTLPLLLWIGFEPATAITTNTIAMASSAFGGTMAYRRELRAEWQYIRPLTLMSVAGGIVGATLLLSRHQRPSGWWCQF